MEVHKSYIKGISMVQLTRYFWLSSVWNHLSLVLRINLSIVMLYMIQIHYISLEVGLLYFFFVHVVQFPALLTALALRLRTPSTTLRGILWHFFDSVEQFVSHHFPFLSTHKGIEHFSSSLVLLLILAVEVMLQT